MTGIPGGMPGNPPQAGRGLITSPASSIPFSIEPCKRSSAGEPGLWDRCWFTSIRYLGQRVGWTRWFSSINCDWRGRAGCLRCPQYRLRRPACSDSGSWDDVDALFPQLMSRVPCPKSTFLWMHVTEVRVGCQVRLDESSLMDVSCGSFPFPAIDAYDSGSIADSSSLTFRDRLNQPKSNRFV